MKLVDVPFFVAPYKDNPGGVDFLGLRQVNLDLMYEFLPGINNVTSYVRPYSVMTWFAWSFHEEMKRRRIEDFTRKDFKAYREKVELLFGWSHQVERTSRGMVGSTSKPPGTGSVPLTFEAWKRNVSWLDAVNYGPSLKMDNGLGLLAQVRQGIFAVTSLGKELAEALDAELRPLSGYRVLRGAAEEATEAVARSLHAGWNIDKPSARERKVLWSALFDQSAIGREDAIGRRSSSVRLIEIALAAAGKPMHGYQVRESLAYGSGSGGRFLGIPDALVGHHHLWTGVQVRQAQRLAMEAFFAWLEREVLFQGLRDTQALARKARELIADSEHFAGAGTPAEALGKLRRYAAKQKRPLWRGSSDASLDMFSLMYELQDAIGDEDAKDLCSLSLWLLLLGVAITEELAAVGVSKDILELGGLPRVSLAQWSRHVERHAAQKFGSFLVNFIEIFMLSQHFGTATRRYEVGKQRLRVTIEEQGLTPMIAPNDLWYPSPAPDRMEAMLSLMADCGVIRASSDGYSLKS